ncbi:MAG: ATP-dependent DNA ligase [Saprospiraceae bacterium]
MRQFSELFIRMDQSNKTNDKVDALVDYLREAPVDEQLWGIAILSHRRPKRTVNTTLLRNWAAEMSKLPLWLFEDSYHIVGDLAETIALVLPEKSETTDYNLRYWIDYIRALDQLSEADKKAAVLQAWNQLDYGQRFIFNKLITGNWRIGVSDKLVARAIAKFTGLTENVVLHRLAGAWSPDHTTFQELILSENAGDDLSKPYPFCLAYPLEQEPETLGPSTDWTAEYKWDGIRGQIIKRQGELYVWSRGEELVTDKYPEYEILRSQLPDGIVLDGEIIGWKEGLPLPFASIQTRIGRKTIAKKHLTDTPVVFVAYDVLEYEGKDIRNQPFRERRATLEKVVELAQADCLVLSVQVEITSWEALAEIRAAAGEMKAEGLMLKKADSVYKTGRKRGDWWKWKLEPRMIDAVMIYAQQGAGRRANLYTDFTFAVWSGEDLVPFTKAYSGLTDEEFRKIDAWIRKNTLERFGPVRSVKPEQVFEIAFEGIQESKRHKSGIALRFPRMNRWRTDKKAEEANTLADLQVFLKN